MNHVASVTVIIIYSYDFSCHELLMSAKRDSGDSANIFRPKISNIIDSFVHSFSSLCAVSLYRIVCLWLLIINHSQVKCLYLVIFFYSLSFCFSFKPFVDGLQCPSNKMVTCEWKTTQSKRNRNKNRMEKDKIKWKQTKRREREWKKNKGDRRKWDKWKSLEQNTIEIIVCAESLFNYLNKSSDILNATNGNHLSVASMSEIEIAMYWNERMERKRAATMAFHCLLRSIFCVFFGVAL